jgi:hypothetical protein
MHEEMPPPLPEVGPLPPEGVPSAEDTGRFLLGLYNEMAIEFDNGWNRSDSSMDALAESFEAIAARDPDVGVAMLRLVRTDEWEPLALYTTRHLQQGLVRAGLDPMDERLYADQGTEDRT